MGEIKSQKKNGGKNEKKVQKIRGRRVVAAFLVGNSQLAEPVQCTPTPPPGPSTSLPLPSFFYHYFFFLPAKQSKLSPMKNVLGQMAANFSRMASCKKNEKKNSTNTWTSTHSHTHKYTYTYAWVGAQLWFFSFLNCFFFTWFPFFGFYFCFCCRLHGQSSFLRIFFRCRLCFGSRGFKEMQIQRYFVGAFKHIFDRDFSKNLLF